MFKTFFLACLFGTVVFAQEPRTGQELFQQNCSKCHANILGVTNDGGYDNTYITPAPYVKDLVKKLKSKTGSQEKFTEFVREYIQDPNKRKSLYGKRAIKKFGLMPPLKGLMTDEEIDRLANYLYHYNDKKAKPAPKPAPKKVVSKGEKLFNKNCSKCHANILGVANDGGYENSYITPAPYIADLVPKVKSKTGSQEKFTEFVREYIQNPNKRKSLYGKRAIKKFGLMPPLKGIMTDEEIDELADYLYNYKPE